jgi:hypothetical protein
MLPVLKNELPIMKVKPTILKNSKAFGKNFSAVGLKNIRIAYMSSGGRKYVKKLSLPDFLMERVEEGSAPERGSPLFIGQVRQRGLKFTLRMIAPALCQCLIFQLFATGPK